MEHITSATDAKMHPALKVSISPPRQYDDLTFVGAVDLLPKLVFTELEDMICDVELAAYFYWGLLLVKIKTQQMPAFTETLPEGVCVVDNIDSTTLVLQLTDLKTHGIKLPIVIEKGCAAAVISEAELLPDFYGLPWFNFLLRGDKRAHIVATVKALQHHECVLDVFLCPSVSNLKECLVFGFQDEKPGDIAANTASNDIPLNTIVDDANMLPPNKKRKRDEDDVNNPTLNLQGTDCIDVYTDGACGNNGTDRAKAGIGLAIYDSRSQQSLFELSEPFPQTMTHVTNQRAELWAAVRLFQLLENNTTVTRIRIFSDSAYLVNGMKVWRFSWVQKGWPAKIKNQDIWKTLIALADARKHSIEWHHVYGHTGNAKNERADRLAAAGVSK